MNLLGMLQDRVVQSEGTGSQWLQLLDGEHVRARLSAEQAPKGRVAVALEARGRQLLQQKVPKVQAAVALIGQGQKDKWASGFGESAHAIGSKMAQAAVAAPAVVPEVCERGEPERAAAPAPAEVAPPATVAAAPAAAVAEPVVAAPAPATAPAPVAPPTGPTAEQNEKMRVVWASCATPDPFQVLRWMDEFGMSVSQAASASGVSEFEFSCLLVRLGVPKGHGGLAFSREEVNADFEAQLRAAGKSEQWRTTYIFERGGDGGGNDTASGFNMSGFMAHYQAQNTEASRLFGAVHGQAHMEGSDPNHQTVRFDSGYGSATTWAVNDKAQALSSAPKASAEQREEIKASLIKDHAPVLAAYGTQEPLPDNVVTAALRSTYGEELATLMYRLDKAMQLARDDYMEQLQQAVSNPNSPGATTHKQVVYDESGQAQEITTHSFDPRAFHAALMERTDAKSQVLKELFGTLEAGANGAFVLKGAGGTQHFKVSDNPGGPALLEVGQRETPQGTVRIDLANPPKLYDATRVGYIPGVGFVTDAINIVPPPKKKKKRSWLKTVVTIAAVVAVGAFTAGTAAPALLGTMGVSTTSLAGAMITGAVTSAATAMTSGLLTTGKIDLKATLKSAVVGAVTAGVMDQVKGLQAYKTATDTVKLGTRMVVQGTLQEAQGGKFKDGALAALSQELGDKVRVATSGLGEVLSNGVGKAAGIVVRGGGDDLVTELAKDYLRDGVDGQVRDLVAGPRNGMDVESDQAAAAAERQREQSGNGRIDTQKSGLTQGLGPLLQANGSPATPVDPLEQASPPPDLYGDTNQWAQDNQRVLEDAAQDYREQQRAQEQARSTAQGSFRQSELESQRSDPAPFDPQQYVAENPLSGLDLASDQAHALAGNVPVRTESRVRAGDFNGSLERVATSQLGAGASQREINNYVGQLFELNGVSNARAIQPNDQLLLPDANTPAATSGLRLQARDNAVGQQINAQRAAELADRAAGFAFGAGAGQMGQGQLPSGASDPFAAFPKPASPPATAFEAHPFSSRDEWNIPSLKDSLLKISSNENLSVSEKLSLSGQRIQEEASLTARAYGDSFKETYFEPKPALVEARDNAIAANVSALREMEQASESDSFLVRWMANQSANQYALSAGAAYLGPTTGAELVLYGAELGPLARGVAAELKPLYGELADVFKPSEATLNRIGGAAEGYMNRVGALNYADGPTDQLSFTSGTTAAADPVASQLAQPGGLGNFGGRPLLAGELDFIGPMKPSNWDALRSHPDGHAFGVHGGGVSDAGLVVRARTGVKPDGSTGPIPPLSSAFHSDDLLIATDQIIRDSGGLANAITRQPGQSVVRVETQDVGNLGMDLGYGYVRLGATGNKAANAAGVGPLQRIQGMNSAQGIYEFNPTTGVWETITIYPAPY